MIKGTTPRFTFKLPFAVDLLSNAKVTLRQGDIYLEKKLCDCETTENSLTVRLTQEETFMFECKSFIKMQLRVLTENGDALATRVFEVYAKQCLDEEVLS